METNITRNVLLVFFILPFLHQKGAAEQDGKGFLINAVKQRNIEIMQWLLNQEALIDVQDSEGKTALIHAAAMKNSSNIVKVLLDAGADQNVKDNDGFTAFLFASQTGTLEVLKLLNKNVSEKNITDRQGRTPLHVAVQQDNEETVSYLLDNGFNPYIQDNHGLTIMHLAAMYGKTSILRILKNKGKYFDTVANGKTPLMLALLYDQKDAAEFLITNGANITYQDSNIWTYLHWAAYTGYKKLIELLVDNCRNIDILNSDGRTPLYLAVKSGHFSVAKYLIDKGANINLTDRHGNNLLHAAANSGNTNMIEYFINNSIDLDKPNQNGTTPLIVASIKGHGSAVEVFISNGADANAKDKNGMSLVFALAQLGDLHLLKQVHKLYENLSYDVRDLQEATPLHYASQSNNVELLEYLINAMVEDNYFKSHNKELRLKRALGFKLKVCPLCYKNITNNKDLNGKTPTYYAAVKGNAEIINVLQKYGGNVSITDNNGQSPLHAAAASDQNVDTLNVLVVQTPNIDTKDLKGKTALFLSVEAGQIDSVKYLIDVGANVEIRNNDGLTTMHAAAINGHTAVVSELGLQQRKLVNIQDNEGKTPAWYAVYKGYTDTLNMLSELGAQIKPDINIFEATKNGQLDIIKFLFTRCNSPLGRNKEGQSLLHIAAAAGQTLVIKELSKYRCLMNSTDYMMKTPAWYALSGGHWDSLEELLHNGAEIKPLFNIIEIIKSGQLNTFKYLFNEGPKIYYNNNNASLVYTASEAGKYDIVEFLIESGVDFKTREDGQSPLYIAWANNFCNIVNLLLKKGARDSELNTDIYYPYYDDRRHRQGNCRDILRQFNN